MFRIKLKLATIAYLQLH